MTGGNIMVAEEEAGPFNIVPITEPSMLSTPSSIVGEGEGMSRPLRSLVTGLRGIPPGMSSTYSSNVRLSTATSAEAGQEAGSEKAGAGDTVIPASVLSSTCQWAAGRVTCAGSSMSRPAKRRSGQSSRGCHPGLVGAAVGEALAEVEGGRDPGGAAIAGSRKFKQVDSKLVIEVI